MIDTYLKLGAPEIYLAPMRKADREEHKKRGRLTRAVKQWLIEEFGPEVQGYDGPPCPRCRRTRIMSVAARGALNGHHSIPSRKWWRCCGLAAVVG